MLTSVLSKPLWFLMFSYWVASSFGPPVENKSSKQHILAYFEFQQSHPNCTGIRLTFLNKWPTQMTSSTCRKDCWNNTVTCKLMFIDTFMESFHSNESDLSCRVIHRQVTQVSDPISIPLQVINLPFFCQLSQPTASQASVTIKVGVGGESNLGPYCFTNHCTTVLPRWSFIYIKNR